jgi:hypothetical protein
MTNKKILLPFALTALVAFLQGCGGESANINEDPNKGVSGVTSSTSCLVGSDNCLQFVMDYPISGINFDCSSDKINHFATKLESDDLVKGACKLGDEVSFYIQGEGARKIDLGKVKLDNISKLITKSLPRIRLIDLAIGLTGKTPTSLVNSNDETVRVAIGIAKVFQSLSVEQNNVIGDIQRVELTNERKNQLTKISKDIGMTEWANNEYISVLKPWLDVGAVPDDEALDVITKLTNLTNVGVWEAALPIFKPGGDIQLTGVDGFFGCNKGVYDDCVLPKNNLIHSMGSFNLLSDRQGYVIGSGQQWRGAATIINNMVSPPLVLINKVKPVKLQVNAQNEWLNPISREVNATKPLHFSLNNNMNDDLMLYQGKVINDTTMPGTEAFYKKLLNTKDNETVNLNHLTLWQQTISGESYRGGMDIIRAAPANYLDKNIFKTEENVKVGQTYIFPFYATLNFKFQDSNTPPVKIGIVIDENGDIRTDIKKNSTETDMSGVCGKPKTLNPDGTITDTNDQIQYRIGTTGATSNLVNEKSITVRMILSNPKFSKIDGTVFGLNLSAGTGAKINLYNLLAGQKIVSLTNFMNNPVTWSNTFAQAQATYINIYENSETDKNQYVPPTDEERALAKRNSGTVTIELANQNIPECNAIRTK